MDGMRSVVLTPVARLVSGFWFEGNFRFRWCAPFFMLNSLYIPNTCFQSIRGLFRSFWCSLFS